MLPRLVAAAASGGLLSSSVMSSWWITPERMSPNNRFPKCDDGRFFQLFFSPQLTENISGLPDFWGEKWGLKGCNPGANSESTLKKALPLVSWINPLNIATFLKMSAGFSFNSLHTHTWIQNVYISHFLRTHPTLLTWPKLMTNSGRGSTNTSAYFDSSGHKCEKLLWGFSDQPPNICAASVTSVFKMDKIGQNVAQKKNWPAANICVAPVTSVFKACAAVTYAWNRLLS